MVGSGGSLCLPYRHREKKKRRILWPEFYPEALNTSP